MGVGGGRDQNAPLRYFQVWRHQFSCKVSNQQSHAKAVGFTLYPGEVYEAKDVILASEGCKIDRWQKEKNHRQRFGIHQFLS